VRRGVKKRWTPAEKIHFAAGFQSFIRDKMMPSGEEIDRVREGIPGRSLAQIRTRLNNVIRDKQKI
jgi:hypothetical protein